jgi:hypothetical protein
VRATASALATPVCITTPPELSCGVVSPRFCNSSPFSEPLFPCAANIATLFEQAQFLRYTSTVVDKYTVAYADSFQTIRVARVGYKSAKSDKMKGRFIEYITGHIDGRRKKENLFK